MPLQRTGRTWTWKDSPSATAADLEYTLTTASLADAGRRQGVKASLVDSAGRFADLFTVEVDVDPASAPTAGVVVSIYWGGSRSSTAGTSNPIGMTGADAAHVLGVEMLDDIWFLGNAKIANEVANYTHILPPTTLPYGYGMPIIHNQMGVAITTAEIRITEILG